MEQININHDIHNVETAEIPRLQLKNIIGHFQTIRHHKKLVRRECFKMGLYWQGMTHDLSKYSPVEFWSGCRFYQGTRSPNAREREVIGYSRAWLHHKGRNRHHFEYWVDFSTRNSDAPFGVMPARMPDRYIAEMIADRVAASKTYRGKQYLSSDPLRYYMQARQKMPLHPYTQEMLEKFLHMLADEGEEKTFAYIKKDFLHKDKKEK